MPSDSNTLTRDRSQQSQGGQADTSGLTPWVEQMMDRVEVYAREKPWHFGLWMLGVGFVLGWKLKIW